jgi:hypothetical protein
MSFFSRLFGRSKPKETAEAPAAPEAQADAAAEPKIDAKPNGSPPPAPAKPAPEPRREQSPPPNPIQLQRSTQATPAKTPPPPPEPSADLPPPSGNAAAPATGRQTSGLFKKRSASGSKLQPIPKGTPAPVAAVEAKATPTPVPAAPAAPAKPEGGNVLDALLGSLDESFDAIIAEQPDSPPPPGPHDEPNTDDFDRLSVLELFFDIATNHLRPVRNFMIELHLGDVRKEWLQIAQPAVRSIQSAAEQIDIPELKRALDDFDAIMNIAVEAAGDMISGEIREEFINQYKRLAGIMPKAFTLEEERDQRESLIIHSLLMQVPDVRKVTIDRLYRAGLTALEVLFLATTEDLAATTGIRKILAQRIVDKFQSYRTESQSAVPDPLQAGQTNKLAELVTLLRAQQEKYDAARGSIDEKRGHRLARQGTLLEITVVLAQLGEVEVVEQLERLPFERRVERLEAFVASLKERKAEGGAWQTSPRSK